MINDLFQYPYPAWWILYPSLEIEAKIAMRQWEKALEEETDNN